jgi:hypothetical protein
VGLIEGVVGDQALVQRHRGGMGMGMGMGLIDNKL